MRSRAKSLSQVAESAFEDGICEIAPLRLTDPLVTVLKKALADGGSSHFEVNIVEGIPSGMISEPPQKSPADFYDRLEGSWLVQ